MITIIYRNLYHAEERQEAPEGDDYKKMKKEEKKLKNLRGVTLFSSLLGSLLGVLHLGHLFTCFWDHGKSNFFPFYNSTYIIFVAPFRIEVKNFIESLIHVNPLKLNKLSLPFMITFR